MVGILVLWKPILVSAVFVFITTMLIHMVPGWHQRDMSAVPGEDKVMDLLRGLNLRPGEYRFPFGATTKDMESPAFIEKMKSGPVGTMTIRPTGELPFGKMMGAWFVYVLLIAVLAGHVTGRMRPIGAPFHGVFALSSILTFCCYSVGQWQNWIWWGKSTRFTLTYSIDGVAYALVAGATFGWLWPR